VKSIDEIADDINTYVDDCSSLEMTCKYLCIDLAASPLYNFRDSLSHFIRLYEAKTEEEKITQEASIEEHLYRGLKDGCILIINAMKRRSNDALTRSLTETKEQQRAFRKIVHAYKKLEIEMRKNSESNIIRTLEPFIEQLNELLVTTQSTFKQYNVPFKTARVLPPQPGA
jgi:predicted transcriptional regulator YheO